MLTNNSEEIFSADKTPEMVQELSVLKKETAHTPIYFTQINIFHCYLLCLITGFFPSQSNALIISLF